MIEDLLEHIGIEDIQPGATEVGGRCPMHEKRTGERELRPRHWSINRRTGRHHCFSCEYSGSLIRLIMDMAKVGLWDAHQYLRAFEVDLDTPEEDQWVPPAPPVEIEAKLTLFGPPPDRAVERRRLTRESLERLCVRWDYEDPSWIFPIYGPAGDLWGWQAKGAEMVRNRPPGIRKSKTLFGIQAPKDNSYVVLLESPLDVVYLDGLGYPALSSFGAEVSDIQMHLIVERFDEVVLALDNDKAGCAETRRLLRERWHHRLPTTVFSYRGIAGKDPGECHPEEIRRGITERLPAALW